MSQFQFQSDWKHVLFVGGNRESSTAKSSRVAFMQMTTLSPHAAIALSSLPLFVFPPRPPRVKDGSGLLCASLPVPPSLCKDTSAIRKR